MGEHGIRRSASKLGYQNLPILPEIKHDKFVIDLLHMFIQIGHVLIDLVIDSITFADNIYDSTKFYFNEHINTAKFANFLHNECKRNRIEEGLNLKELRIAFKQNLTGPPLRIIFRNTFSDFTLSSILGAEYEVPSSLWSKFWEIDTLLRSDENYSPEDLENKTKEFHNYFTTAYHLEKMTPYIHIFCFHLHESYRNFGNLNYFSAQGLEKLNDLSTFDFFGGTNKHKDFIKQMLEKDFRIAFLEDKFDENFSRKENKFKKMALNLERIRKNSELPVVKFTKNLPDGEIIEIEKNLGNENGEYFYWAVRSEELKKIKYIMR